MHVLRIEHPVPDFDGWKKAFDNDPVGRRRSGVRRYQVLRPVEDPKFVLVDLEFDCLAEAEAFLAVMQVIWGRVEGSIMRDPRARILEAVETREF